ncbi:MAG: hypothetical protein AB2L07_21005 [Thermoanaerobaculaceae bacterium]
MPQDPKLTTLGKLVVLLFILGGLAAALVSWRGGLDAVLGPVRRRPGGTAGPRTGVPGRAGWGGVTSTWTWRYGCWTGWRRARRRPRPRPRPRPGAGG